MARSILAAMPVALPVFVMALALLLSAPPCLGAAAAAGSAKGTTTSGTAAGRQATVQQHQLSTPRVLLPAVSAALETIRYNLSASGGCYLWASRRPDVVQVHSHAGEQAGRRKACWSWRDATRGSVVMEDAERRTQESEAQGPCTDRRNTRWENAM